MGLDRPSRIAGTTRGSDALLMDEEQAEFGRIAGLAVSGISPLPCDATSFGFLLTVETAFRLHASIPFFDSYSLA
jgi:hypothetical protein